jgi:hypothetical protein
VIITDELLEKALSYERPGDQQLRKYASTVRGMLELVADEIVEMCAKKAEEYSISVDAPADPHPMNLQIARNACKTVKDTRAALAAAIRSLKSKPHG